MHNFGTCDWRTAAQWRNPIFFCVETHFLLGNRNCAAVLQSQVPKLCTDLDLSLLYILILRTYSRFARKNHFLSIGVCFPQPCSSAGHRFAASISCIQNYRQIFSFPLHFFFMKCVVNWIPLSIHVRSSNTQPHRRKRKLMFYIYWFGHTYC